MTYTLITQVISIDLFSAQDIFNKLEKQQFSKTNNLY